MFQTAHVQLLTTRAIKEHVKQHRPLLNTFLNYSGGSLCTFVVTHPWQEGEEIVFLVVYDISWVSLLSLFRMAQPHGPRTEISPSTASGPRAAPEYTTSSSTLHVGLIHKALQLIQKCEASTSQPFNRKKIHIQILEFHCSHRNIFKQATKPCQ